MAVNAFVRTICSELLPRTCSLRTVLRRWDRSPAVANRTAASVVAQQVALAIDAAAGRGNKKATRRPQIPTTGRPYPFTRDIVRRPT